MLLSDELIAMGRESNPKSNLSQSVVVTKIHERMIEAKLDPKSQDATFQYVCRALAKEDYSYFKKLVRR